MSEPVATSPATHPEIDRARRVEIEAAVYRKLIAHLRQYPEVQNIDLMNLAYFCRNCFAKWYMRAAAEQGVTLDTTQAREQVYGMPYAEYQAQHQREATAQQREKFADAQTKATE